MSVCVTGALLVGRDGMQNDSTEAWLCDHIIVRVSISVALFINSTSACQSTERNCSMCIIFNV